ncbi:hypothetical protein PCANC_11934 [Puccinia coronata f. sp. avenae]|uniref:hAT-like transposase RNase-H fold domain-containing protein n=1 Tax=Puccinia coronata f. sp. avenae TaxID=200324 RepID=A0A2N5T390_9BASI|nr:hypothetical protein PCANC_11934 [Puccinia coronata f. sp. avenae]
MLDKTKTYLQEALKCDAIILATAFNPAYCLSMIQAWFPQRFNYVKTLLQDKFNDRKLELEVAAKENLIQASLPLTRESGPNQTGLDSGTPEGRGVQPRQTGVLAMHACPEGVQALHALRTGVHGRHACPARLT